MKILAIESSGQTAGCALAEGDRLICEYYMNNGLTHSVTLLPMIEHMLQIAEIQPEELDGIAVSKGPGSFTGLRIGAATAKGLGLALNIPLVGVSSLEAMAANLPCTSMLLCPMMDARQNQVYGAIYEGDEEKPFVLKALLPDAALSIEDFLREAKKQAEMTGKKLCFSGDGVPVHEEAIRAQLGAQAVFAPASVNRQRAGSVALLGGPLLEKGLGVCSDDFAPDYVRKPLAETKKDAGTLEDAGKRSLEKIAREYKNSRKHRQERDHN